MAANVLVLAQRTAGSAELLSALKARSERGPIHATLVMPAAGPGSAARAEARERLDNALGRWREAGIDSDGVVGDCIALQALLDTFDPLRHDELYVCTLPGQSSKWLQGDLPRVAARATGLPVHHVIAPDPDAVVARAQPVPAPEPKPLGRFQVLVPHVRNGVPHVHDADRVTHGSSSA